MRFLLDQDVYALTARHLLEAGHDVLKAADLGMSRAADIELLRKAHDLGRIFVTRDSDFGRLVFFEGEHAGIIFLRMTPTNFAEIHQVLDLVLSSHESSTLAHSFVVINASSYRIRNPN